MTLLRPNAFGHGNNFMGGIHRAPEPRSCYEQDTVTLEVALDLDTKNGLWSAFEAIDLKPDAIEGPMWFQICAIAQDGFLVTNDLAVYVTVEVTVYNIDGDITSRDPKPVAVKLMNAADERTISTDHPLVKLIVDDPNFYEACARTAEDRAKV